MRARRSTPIAALVLALGLATGVDAPAAVSGAPVSAREWVKRLLEAGRGEVAFVRTSRDPLSGEDVSERGRLALEPPGRAEVTFPRTGERLTVRPDGGEWLQPGLGQMIRFGPGGAGVARSWWELLLAAGDGGTARAGTDRLVLGPAREGARDSAWVRLDAAGLPVRLALTDVGARVVYRLERWRFVKPRGAAGFRQRAPAGVEVIDLE